MSLRIKNKSTKLHTQPNLTKSLPKLQNANSKTIFYQSRAKFNIHQFPEPGLNPELLLKKTFLNLSVAKRISTLPVDQGKVNHKKILPHHINPRKSFTKLTGLKIQKEKVLNDDNLIHITAQKWLIYDCKNGEVIKGFKYKKQHDVASLSKMLTFYTAFRIIKQYKLSIDKTDFIVMEDDQVLGGSKILLKSQNIITLEDTLYAMLLNSANNAATVLANNLGFLCLRKRQGKYFSCFDINKSNRRSNIQFFVTLMTKFSMNLELIDTSISNPHGMSKNISTTRDMAKLFQNCWKNPLFRKILQTKQREIQIKFVDNEGKLRFTTIKLKNTNKMGEYNRFCLGGKTGQNKNGGHSFIGYFQDPIENRKLIIVALGSFGKEQKFRDTDKLYDWAKDRKKQIIESNVQEKQKISDKSKEKP